MFALSCLPFQVYAAFSHWADWSLLSILDFFTYIKTFDSGIVEITGTPVETTIFQQLLTESLSADIHHTCTCISQLKQINGLLLKVIITK